MWESMQYISRKGLAVYRKVLLLLDGSELAEVVFHYAQKLSGRLGVDLELLHVASAQEAEQLPMRRAYIEHMAELLCTSAEETGSTEPTADALAQCVQARGTVVVGDPAEEILEYIEANDVDLVMMSSHGRSGIKSFSLGAVANKVVHASKVPVWLVPAELREEVIADTLVKRPLVIPLSGSEISEAAIPHALKVVEQREAESEIVLVHAFPAPPSTVATLAVLEDRDKAIRRMEAYLDLKAESIRQAGVPARTVMLHGDPAESVIAFLRDEPAQLLVMATRGRRGLSKMVFGSVTEEVIHMIKKTPMLLVSGSED
jgi:nucleotide-binding universal stress UspA family protein